MECVQHRALFMNSVTIRFVLYCTVHCIFIFHNRLELATGIERLYVEFSAKPACKNTESALYFRKFWPETKRGFFTELKIVRSKVRSNTAPGNTSPRTEYRSRRSIAPTRTGQATIIPHKPAGLFFSKCSFIIKASTSRQKTCHISMCQRVYNWTKETGKSKSCPVFTFSAR